jgi:hypothetical protein
MQVRNILSSTTVVCYSFDQIFTAIQPYLKEGVQFDMQTNQGYPANMGLIYTFTLQEYEDVDQPDEVPELPDETPEKPTEAPTEVTPAPTTRRAKSKASN